MPSAVTTSGLISISEASVSMKRAVERCEHRGELAGELVAQSERERDLARLVTGRTDQRIDRLGDDFLGRLGGDLFDLDSALGTRDHRDRAGFPIDQHPEVELARDLTGFLNVDPPHDAALRPGLMGDERLAEQLLGEGARLLGARYEFHAARFAATAGVNLRFRHRLGHAERGEGFRGGVGRFGSLPFRHRRSEARENLFGLKFVDVHWGLRSMTTGGLSRHPRLLAPPSPATERDEVRSTELGMT